MPVLTKELRARLEKAVQDARDLAEQGSRAALQQLGIDQAEAPTYLAESERELRNRLRARARQLGDTRDTSGMHAFEHLMSECAYEHWHRMLFARFLAENKVLMHPDGVAVTLEECGELAKDEGVANGWAVAERYAQRMLPQIFRPDAPVLQVQLPTEKQVALERLLAGLPAEIFGTSDALGWVYQFWQAKQKAKINSSGTKIGADELPAVTQLFTEPYMVDFLLQNTLGAWWVSQYGRESLPLEMTYLRFREDGMPMAGIFDEWPKNVVELKVLDPCCGSGHFLVAAFNILVRFRMAEEKLDSRAACDAVLRDNIHGLEIDPRCTEIAAFALALSAWTYPGAGGWRALPELHIACSGLAPHAKKNDWLVLAGDDAQVRKGMDRLFDLFRDAPTLGSLIDPAVVGFAGEQKELGVASFLELQPILDGVLKRDERSGDYDRDELSITAKGVVGAAHLLTSKFHLIATNVPYLTRGKQGETLQKFSDEYCQNGSADIATVFLKRCRKFCVPGGCYATVAPLNWLFLGSYGQFRVEILTDQMFRVAAKLGSGATATASWDVLRALTVIVNSRATVNYEVTGLETDSPTESGRAACLLKNPVLVSTQSLQLSNPDARIALGNMGEGKLLALHAESFQGLKTGDDPRFRRMFWEVAKLGDRWKKLQSTANVTRFVGGMESIVDWADGGRQLARKQGLGAWGKLGVAVNQMRSLPCTLYLGDAFDSNVSPVVVRDLDALPALWAFCASAAYHEEVRRIDQSLKVTNATLVKVPFDIEYWKAVAFTQFPNGLPQPQSDDPTQWIFGAGVVDSSTPLHVAVARLLGYHWPAQKPDALDAFSDDDGIVCIPPVGREEAAADRLPRLLEQAYASSWSPQKLAELLTAVGCVGKSLEIWLRDNFFEQHCEIFHQRPFLWHIWDGLKKDGFGALVNYHKLDRKLLETLTYTYLGDWIRRQEDGAKNKADGASERLAAARLLQQKLEKILDGEAPLDIFVRWKPRHEQSIGWEPDINDGVLLNIRPFVAAGILRKNPKIDWKKDRGKDPEDAPWGEDRINDRHLTLSEKRAARVAAENH